MLHKVLFSDDDFRLACQNLSVSVTLKSLQDYTCPDNHTDMTPGFKSFTVIIKFIIQIYIH